jgi:hypothetical protein
MGQAGERSPAADEREGEMNGPSPTEENFEFEFFNFAPSLIRPEGGLPTLKFFKIKYEFVGN